MPKRRSKKDVFRSKFLNEPFTREMLDIFESEVRMLEKAYFKQLGRFTYTTGKAFTPSRSGNLRDSATLSSEINYATGEAFNIKYAAPYAYSIHEGEQMEPADLEATGEYPWSRYTRSYKRKDGTTVSEHRKTYKKYYKPVQVNNTWVSIDQTSIKPRANKWMQKAWKFVFKREDSLARKLLPRELIIKKPETS